MASILNSALKSSRTISISTTMQELSIMYLDGNAQGYIAMLHRCNSENCTRQHRHNLSRFKKTKIYM